jgi:acetyltransferase-like isoleucine patch superfamily enzyme
MRIDKYKTKKSALNNKPVFIGNDVWVGAKSIILPGITIGDGTVIGAGSVVTKNVLPYTIVAGNPARIIRKRFSENKIEQILGMDIYEKEIDLIKIFNKYNDLPIEKFIEILQRHI